MCICDKAGKSYLLSAPQPSQLLNRIYKYFPLLMLENTCLWNLTAGFSVMYLTFGCQPSGICFYLVDVTPADEENMM